jgi:aminoglycoside phosphotransferase (APT) family kinase protein
VGRVQRSAYHPPVAHQIADDTSRAPGTANPSNAGSLVPAGSPWARSQPPGHAAAQPIPEVVAKLVGYAYPRHQLNRIEPIAGQGKINEVFLVSLLGAGERIVRISHRPDALVMFRRSQAALSLIQKETAVPVPKVEVVLPLPDAKGAFMVQSRLPGRSAQQVIDDVADPTQSTTIRQAVWEQVGMHVRAIHELPEEQLARRLGQLFLRSDPQRPPKVWQSLEFGSRLDLRDLVDWASLNASQKLRMEHAATEAANFTSGICVVHRDLQLKNVLIDPCSLAVTGIIDWDFVDVAPAYTEFAKLRLKNNLTDYGAFVTGYGDRAPSDQATVDGLAAIQELPYLVFLGSDRKTINHLLEQRLPTQRD